MSVERRFKKSHTMNARAAHKDGASESTRPDAEKRRGTGATSSPRRREKPRETEPGRPIAGGPTRREKQRELLPAGRADGGEKETSKEKRLLTDTGLLTRGSTDSSATFGDHRLLARLNDEG